MTATWLPEHNQPLLRLTPNELAIAPEFGVLAALDAILVPPPTQLIAQHPDLALDSLARGDLPSPEDCKANHLCVHIHDLRAAIKDYRQLALKPEPEATT